MNLIPRAFFLLILTAAAFLAGCKNESSPDQISPEEYGERAAKAFQETLQKDTEQNQVEKVAIIFVRETARTGLAAYRLDTGSYPAEGLEALIRSPSGEDQWRGPYLDNIPNDPWGNPYRYKFPGTRSNRGYDVWSLGPDGIDSTSDDIGNW